MDYFIFFSGLLRFARNDEAATLQPHPVIASRDSGVAIYFFLSWIASGFALAMTCAGWIASGCVLTMTTLRLCDPTASLRAAIAARQSMFYSFLDCFASLAMTAAGWIASGCVLTMTTLRLCDPTPSLRAAIAAWQSREKPHPVIAIPGLLRLRLAMTTLRLCNPTASLRAAIAARQSMFYSFLDCFGYPPSQ
jgi:hypothetical protein